MPADICRLCRVESTLQLSHVVPAFVFRWLRETSANSHIRSTKAPNLRVQDGPQQHWLCSDCEMRLGKSETSFAKELFYPYVQSSGQRFRYSSWLLKFCVSVSWRNLLIQRDHLKVGDLSDEHLRRISDAEESWRHYLLDQTSNPGPNRQFLMPLDQIESTTMSLSPNINRYLMRAIDLDLCHGENSIFTYSKLGRFVIIGFVYEPDLHQWRGGRVGAGDGFIEPRNYVLPSAFGEYINGKAKVVRDTMGQISPKQKAKIEKPFLSNAERLIGSDFFTAMQADVEMFGGAAFTPMCSPTDER